MQNLSMTRQLLRSLLALTLLLLPLLTASNLPAQERPEEVKVTAADIATATAFATNMRYHLFLAKTAAAKNFPADSPGVNFSFPKSPAGHPITSLPSFPAGTGFYPDDVEKLSGTGKTIVTTKSHLIFVNTASCQPGNTGTIANCWGNPTQFLGDLGVSSMIHLVDQYTGSIANNRYTVDTTPHPVNVTVFAGTTGVPTIGESDIIGVVHGMAKTLGTGYGHLYHVFLPKGMDHCFDGGPCYSPEIPGLFVFCAYHFTVHFTDLNANVYYTVEPYQGPEPSPFLSCEVPPGTVNGQIIDSTDTTLSHEAFESITDPDINTGYRAVNSNFGEIGDLCTAFIFNGVTLGIRKYAIQAEYSDKYEACATTP